MCSRPVAGAAAAIGLLGTVASAQTPYPIYTADHLARTMETLGPNFAATVASVDAADYATAKHRLIRSREQLATTITFWRGQGRDDAVGFVRAALGAMDDLDAVMSAAAVDAGRAAALADGVRSACASCHAVYREHDPATGTFRLKPGAVE